MPISGTYTAGDAISFKDCFVEVDVDGDGSGWADIDSWAVEVVVGGEDVPTSETYPFEGSAIVFAGVKSPVEITVRYVYTEGSTDPFQIIRDVFEANDGPDFDVRFAPAGSGSGNFIYTTSGGKLIAAPPPGGSGDASEATVVEFMVRADSLARSAM